MGCLLLFQEVKTKGRAGVSGFLLICVCNKNCPSYIFTFMDEPSVDDFSVTFSCKDAAMVLLNLNWEAILVRVMFIALELLC